MKHAKRADRRPLAAFLLVLLGGLTLLLWATGRPAADAARASAPDPPSVGQPAQGRPAITGPAEGPVVPTWIQIPAIDVDTAVEARGTVRYENAFTGEPVDGFGVPESMATTSWWSDGPRPGSGRMAVVLGHAAPTGYAVFNRLQDLRPGDRVVLIDAGGAALTLEVMSDPLTGLDKASSALADALDGHPAGADLALVTCGGQYDADAQASEDNTVVFAAVVPA